MKLSEQWNLQIDSHFDFHDRHLTLKFEWHVVFDYAKMQHNSTQAITFKYITSILHYAILSNALEHTLNLAKSINWQACLLCVDDSTVRTEKSTLYRAIMNFFNCPTACKIGAKMIFLKSNKGKSNVLKRAGHLFLKQDCFLWKHRAAAAPFNFMLCYYLLLVAKIFTSA